MNDSDQSQNTAAVKIPVMIFMFLEIIFFGSLPLRLRAFKENKLVLSMSGAFSGGLFLGIGLIHLLPESNESFEIYYKEKENPQDDNDEEHFPWAFFISTMAFALILFIEKILTAGWGLEVPHGHSHQHGHDHENQNVQQNSSSVSGENKNNTQSQEQINFDQQSLKQGQKGQTLQQPLMQNQGQNKKVEQIDSDAQEEEMKDRISTTRKSIISISKLKENQSHSQEYNKLTPYILQIAIGIHAIFEGMAIGLQQDWVGCLAISLAVVFHKWAEGLTLGIAYRKANIDLKTSTINIFIQASMNPIGIGIGWALSNQGDLVEGIFTSISVGTFIYIATMEVLVEEFNINRYRYEKFGLFMVALGFVCSLFFMEQAAGG